ncbi:MAG: thiol peroxidase [Prevotellaceae bacterium]|jgi:thiol peroxidase|nr:thiol peroxidase [Prevotellaceae bacterium]
MAAVKFKEINVNTNGELPETGKTALDFILTGKDLQEIRLSDFRGKRVLLNIFPSLDTGTCAASVRRFNKWVSEKENVVVLCVSKDLPFAQARFCGAEGLDNVITASDFRYNTFATDYGVLLTDGPLKGLMSRAVVAIDEKGEVLYTELVEQLVNEPNYDIDVF